MTKSTVKLKRPGSLGSNECILTTAMKPSTIVSCKALDRALQIARRLRSLPPESLASIKRLVRDATETPLERGLALERNLFMKLCIADTAVARMQSYEKLNITSPSRSIEVGPEFQS